MTHYTYKIEKEIKLSRPLSDDMASKFVLSPFHYQLFFHGLIKFYKDDGSSFFENEYLLANSKFSSHQPDLEGDTKSTYEVQEFTLEPKFKFIRFKMIEPGSKSALSAAQASLTYAERDGSSTIKVVLECNAPDETPIQLAKVTYEHVAKRVERLAIDEGSGLKNLQLISDAEFITEYNLNSQELPNSITAKFLVDTNIENIREIINSSSFLNEIFPSTQKITTTGDKISLGDLCVVKLQNMVFQGVKLTLVEEQVNFTVKNTGNDLKLLSNKKVANFHQLGYCITLAPGENNTTELTISVLYDKSNFMSLASKVQYLSSFVTSKIPEPTLFLMLRARDLLTSSVRLLNNHIKNSLQLELTAKVERKKELPKINQQA